MNTNKKGVNLLKLQQKFERHYEILKAQYPNVTRDSLLKGLDIYAELRGIYRT